MSTYVVFKKHVYEPDNKVYFEYDLGDALNLKEGFNQTTGEEWAVAEVYDESSWIVKLLFWLARKSRD